MGVLVVKRQTKKELRYAALYMIRYFLKTPGRFVGADVSVRPQNNPFFMGEYGKFVTSKGQAESPAPTRFYGSPGCSI